MKQEGVDSRSAGWSSFSKVLFWSKIGKSKKFLFLRRNGGVLFIFMSKDLSMAELLKKNSDLRFTFNRGDVVEGKIVAVKDKYALIDIGAKSEGVLPASEFKDREMEIGKNIWVFVVTPEDREGQILLSLKKAAVSKAWEDLALALKDNTSLEVVVSGHNKGGLIVNIFGLLGFIPFSHLIHAPDAAWERPQMQSFLDRMRGQNMKVQVIELNESDDRIILSEKKAEEEEIVAKKQEALISIKNDQVLEVEIIAILPYGLKVAGLGAEGLIPTEEAAWEQKEGLLSSFSVGQKLTAKVIEVDSNSGRLRLSLKQTTVDPWEELAQKIKKENKLSAEISKVTSFGVFVKVSGLEGMLPLSEFSDDVDIKIGGKLEVKVSSIDKANKRLDLKLA